MIKPLLIEMVEVLLGKGETIKMTSSIDNNTVDVTVLGVSFWNSANDRFNGWYFECEFCDGNVDEIQECEEQRTDSEIEIMTLMKFGNTWALFP